LPAFAATDRSSSPRIGLLLGANLRLMPLGRGPLVGVLDPEERGDRAGGDQEADERQRDQPGRSRRGGD
jgi:hypothetical protein